MECGEEQWCLGDVVNYVVHCGAHRFASQRDRKAILIRHESNFIASGAITRERMRRGCGGTVAKAKGNKNKFKKL